MPRKKNPNNNYFNSEVEEAVCKYINADSQTEKERAFQIIYPAFCKIAEVMANKMKLTYYDTTREDLMTDAVTFMVQKMHMFDCSAGKKAFSYFTVVCKHWLILENNKNHKYFRRYNPISQMGNTFDRLDENIEADIKAEEAASLLQAFTDYLEINFDKVFDSKKYVTVGNVLLDKLRNWEDIEEINHRKIFHNMFVESNYTTRGNFTKVMNMVSTHYFLFKKRWEKGDSSLEFIRKVSLTDEEKEILKNEYVAYNKSKGSVAFAKRFGVSDSVIRDYINTI